MAEAEAQKATAKADGGTSRREFLASFPFVTAAWVAFTGAIAGVGAATMRFLYPNVLYEPPQQFKIGFPADFQVGDVSEAFKDRYGVWVVRNEEGFYALLTVCTHLGCTPNWLATESKFKCPCHGSGFYSSGINFEGPAPRPLERAAIALAEDGQIQVDKSRKFLFEQGGWEDPNSFLPFTA
jgi:cytochrome b6-f complex iron-sulfur subunit